MVLDEVIELSVGQHKLNLQIPGLEVIFQSFSTFTQLLLVSMFDRPRV